MKIIQTISLTLLFIFLSCGKPVLKFKYSREIQLEKINHKEKEIFFIKMFHIGDEKFYSDIAKKIDSLRKEKFIVYYESVANESEIDSVLNDTSLRKLRKVLGYSIDNRLDTSQNILLDKYKIDSDNQIINQKNKILGINENDIKVDIPIYKLIAEFENRYGEIKLTSCDQKTDLSNHKYKCKKIDDNLRKKFKEEIIINFRDKNVAKKVAKGNDKKILIVYGGAHLEGIKTKLKK